jgi:N-acetylmuramic acid 6-phosphate etherase
MQELAHLTTESTNALTAGISSLSAVEILALINDQDSLVAPIVRSQISTIAAAIDSIVPRLQNGGRVVYFGRIHQLFISHSADAGH